MKHNINIGRVSLVCITLSIISTIPIIQNFGKTHIGGDVIIPLIPQFSYKMAYFWSSVDNGLYVVNDYFSYTLIFDFFNRLGLTIYQASFIFQFLIFFLSGLGIYKIFNLFNDKNPLYGLVAALAFIYSPYLLDHMIYFYTTVSIIWLIYFLFKFVKHKTLSMGDCISVAVLFMFMGNLPNPKYHFLIFLIYLVTILICLIIRLIDINDLKKNLKYFFLIIALTTFLWAPLLHFAFNFTQNPTLTNVKTTQEGKARGEARDFGSALISRMMRLFHTPNLNTQYKPLLSTTLYLFGSYLLITTVLGLFPLVFEKNKKQKVYFVYYCLALFLLFLAKGSNPPFGFLYDLTLRNIKVLAFMRTTAGIVIYAAIFYSLIFAFVISRLISKFVKLKYLIFLFAFVIILTAGYPIWSGIYFLNYGFTNVFVDQTVHGKIIPKVYFQTAYDLSKVKLDTKIDIYPSAEGYQANDWGYFGFIIYPWIYDKAIIGFNKYWFGGAMQSQTNAKYILYDKSLVGFFYFNEKDINKNQLIFKSPIINIYRKGNNDYIPHFYIPEKIDLVRNSPNKEKLETIKKIPKPPAIYYAAKQDKIIQIEKRPIIEYKKINPTKYRLRIHKAKGIFPLVFSENFQPSWKLYLTKSDTSTINNRLNSYKILEGNDEEQATIADINQYLKDKVISTLGDGRIKKRNNYIFEKNRKRVDHTESYIIDFISKNFANTIQNDNLSNGIFFESWFKKPLEEKSHGPVNGFANSWLVDSETICLKSSSFCHVNSDGTFDFELIVEFWPQRIAYLGYIFSGVFFIFSFIRLFHTAFVKLGSRS